MKKFNLLFISVLSMSYVIAQDISDALTYSQDEVQGTARFRGMSGAFVALGGDLSAISINPAGAAIFNSSGGAFTLSNLNTKNDVNYYNGLSSSSDSKFDINQIGAVFIYNNTNQNSQWKKLAFTINYDKLSNFDNSWYAVGVSNNSIDNYFLANAQGLRLDEISAFPEESLEDAYASIGSYYGYQNQQAFLGYESYILEPYFNTDDHTDYFSNIASGTFNQDYTYITNGYNGKLSFNVASQYQDNIYLGLNLNSHFMHYDKTTFLHESNSNVGSLVTDVNFENNLHASGTGFSFQLGSIFKITNEFRAGLTYNSPIWYNIREETTQYIRTIRNEGGSNIVQTIDPKTLNVFPEYKLQTAGKFTGGLAYVFGDQGLLSFDYSIKDYGSTKFKPTSDSYFASQNNLMSNTLKNASAYKIGGEYRIRQISLRGGYRFEESPYKDDSFYGDLTGFSLGLGYNFGKMKFDIAFDQSDRNINYLLYSGLSNTANIDSKITNVSATLSFQL